MTGTDDGAGLAARVHEFVRRDFAPEFGQLAETFGTDPHWVRLRELGTELWLDTGSIEDASPLWTREFTALTTNTWNKQTNIRTRKNLSQIRQFIRRSSTNNSTNTRMILSPISYFISNQLIQSIMSLNTIIILI